MACTSCATKSSDGTPRGCKNNGTCGTDSCNKLTVFDWLSNMSTPNGQATFNCVEVRFKNGRKDFYRNHENLSLAIGDIVATEITSGHDIGIVTLTGELVKVQMKKKGVNPDGEVLKIYRKATQKDIDIWQEVRDREEPMKVRARELAINLQLEMKISDIEFQGDGSKATFYYTANDRVDFRQLIKDFAREFSIRIEMKQVGFRQEAARLGGIGSCGRELCCSTWLTDFRSVNTAAARYQQLSLNPQKLAGQCGKLKCCLNYELDTYLDALQDFPPMETKLYTEKGEAVCQKIDIFKHLMWFSYISNSAQWYVLSVDQVNEIIQINKADKVIASIEDYADDNIVAPVDLFENAVGQDAITRFDQPKKKGKPSSRKKRPSEKDAAKPANDRERTDKYRPARSNNKTERGPKPERADKPARTEKPKQPNKQPVVKQEPKAENTAGQTEGQPAAAKPKNNNRRKNFNRTKKENPNSQKPNNDAKE
ncbi:hypothetical protein K5I29_10610 [Flavobacterium agricola]|uniref:PSP1 C-terminal domain-containing protein n=1 Tax=Flavobacterium agricola TaxID=2870839 RepID=A0ABY6M151_9FLAO|nr:regulatory iron-sulfur-containing complex subunit RicT [Flavobacterium agricola]UYW00943.1 hypothetical protein K5I29_10610 [Flavobacterium agricola]